MLFFHGKDSSFNPRIIRKNISLSVDIWGTDLKIWVENSVVAIQHIENRKKSFTEVPPPPIHFAYSCIFTFHTLIKDSMIGFGHWGNAAKFIIKT